jgi:hypothetical protein
MIFRDQIINILRKKERICVNVLNRQRSWLFKGGMMETLKNLNKREKSSKKE